MPKQLKTTKKGFTIIEVVLVLAIAGLIFLMVFLALPALQRSQRDTQRRDDLARFQTAIANYQTNNRGKVPGNASGSAKDNYAKFVVNYLWAGGDEFVDPDGKIYWIGHVCANMASPGTDTNGCTSITEAVTSVNNVLPDFSVANVYAADEGGSTSAVETDGTYVGPGAPTWEQIAAEYAGEKGTFNHAIYVFQNAQCDGEAVVPSSGVRKIAIQYKLEGGGTYCGNN